MNDQSRKIRMYEFMFFFTVHGFEIFEGRKCMELNRNKEYKYVV